MMGQICLLCIHACSAFYSLSISLCLNVLSNMIVFVYVLNICEYDVLNMYIMYTCMLCILLSLSLSVCLSVSLSLSIANMIFLSL